jgi:phosphatidylserine/phosphatidylglycerophosphate/cardiolipin synthase-like enzyme
MLMNDTIDPPPRRFRKRWIVWALLAGWVAVGAWNTFKPMPPGTNVSTPFVATAGSNVQFLNDLTFADAQGKLVYEQRIFDTVFDIIDRSATFVVADFFLFNDLMGAASEVHRPLSRQLADKLIARKTAQPDLSILVITDPINEVYGGARSALLDELRRAGIEVVTTDLEALRDSNAAYSSLWRVFGQWWGNSADGGSMPNPFDTGPSRITLRSWLALLNFKANHRKLVVADSSDGTLTALVASANPHDASSAHSNVALRVSGAPALQMVESELGVARFSGWPGHIYASSAQEPEVPSQDAVNVSFITEQAIRDHLVNALDATRNGDAVRIATFYLSDRKIVGSVLQAAQRGVSVRLILDPNKDAFGRQKDGVPNRPVANELVTKSGQKIEVRWYRTHGEQFHTKLALITQGDKLIASVGSANLTRRNIGNYNLEANLALEMPLVAPLAREMLGYFDRLWTNDGENAIEYTAPFGAYADTDRARYWRYRFMEATGLSTF